jgi:glycine cleavage system H protein
LETSGYVDIFATKGMEYVFILGFIVVLVFFWKFLNRARTPERPGAVNDDPGQRNFRQCNLPANLYYHQGHSWVDREGPEVVRVGVDDFAQKLIGPLDFIDLPRVGAFLEQGEKGWTLGSDSAAIDLLSPVDGEVLEINQKALDDPKVVNRHPYGSGWLLKIRVPKMKGNTSNLLSGKLAAVWMKESIEALKLKISENGASPTDAHSIAGNGDAREPSGGRWNELAREFLLCK